MEENKQAEIHSKGFNMYDRRSYEGPEKITDYNKVKVGPKTLEDAQLNLSILQKINGNLANKQTVLRALAEKNLPLLREISNFFYSTNGIYQRVCNYFAFMYRYDWYIVPQVNDESVKEEKILKDFNSILDYLDDSHIKRMCGNIALEVIKNGAYYGYLIDNADRVTIQQLPINYCRSRYTVNGVPAIEFNMAFFDDSFRDVTYRMKVLNMFPEEFKKGYVLYKSGKLETDDFEGANNDHINQQGKKGKTGWYLLDPSATIKFNLQNSDIPLFVNSIPAILDLDATQSLEQKKQMQQLMKIVIQQLPLDKNGDLIFDVDEAKDIHDNAVQMLSHAIGVDVLTTFADISVEDVADSNSSDSTDNLEVSERTVYNSLGISQNLFNTDSNLSLEKSILNDESCLRDLLLQFHIFFDIITQKKNSNKKKYNFRFYMLETTQYNYKELSKTYKEQVQLGYSKMLPQIALGHSQSSIIHTAYFENEVLHLTEIMIPPLMSSTMSSEDVLGNKSSSKTSTSQTSTEEKSVGRPEKDESEKSDKTIANNESK